MSCPASAVRRLLLAVSAAGLTFLATTSGAGASRPANTPKSIAAPPVVRTSPATNAFAPARFPRPEGRLTSDLAELERVRLREGPDAAARLAEERMLKVQRDRVRVIVVAAHKRRSEAAAAVKAVGGKLARHYRDMLLADVPTSKLTALSRAAGLLAVRPPARPFGAVVSEGVAEIGAEAWHADGLDGAGVKVGVIDLGFSGYPAKLGSELPTTVVTWGGGSAGPEDGGDVHGTAVAEVVHDVAPQAVLHLARIDNEVDLGNAKDWMRSQGVSVINHSVGWYGTEGGDGLGPVNSIVSDAVLSGIFWANSAGNDRRRHWMGDFVDTDGDRLMNWDGSAWEVNTFYAAKSWPIVGFLWWDDSWVNASQDYDLYLYRLVGNEWQAVAWSTNWQDGAAGRTPVEYISHTAPGNSYYAWAVIRFDATRTAVDFDLHSWYQDLDNPSNPYGHFFDHARSISVPADNASVGFMAAAAIGRSPGFAQESYSSEGPTRDGRLAPEMALPAGTTNSVYGVFSGTSASSPHLAGAAALVKQAYPLHAPEDLETYIKAQGVDLGTPGPDQCYGYGRILLPAPSSLDTSPPVGGFVLAGGDAVTATTTLSVDSSVTDAAEMRFDAGSGYGPWKPYSASTTVTLTSAEGTKTVLGQYRDAAANTLTASDTITLLPAGPPAWTYSTGAAALGYPAAHPHIGALFVGSNDGVIRSIDLDSGTLRWSYATGGPVQNQTAVRVAGRPRVFAGSQDGYLYSVDDSGALLWRIGLAGDYDPGTRTFAAPTATDHVQGGVAYLAAIPIGDTTKSAVFAGTYNTGAPDNAFYALDATSGAVLWRDARPGAQLISSYPTVDQATRRVVYTTYEGHVFALDAGDGTPAWDRDLGAAITGSPVISGEAVFVGAGDTLHILALADGAPLRTVTFHAGESWRLGTPWPLGDVVFVSSTRGSVYKVQASTGAVLAEASGLAYARLPVVHGTRVYIGTNDGLKTLDEDLNRLATVRPGQPLASPALRSDTASRTRAFFGDSAGVVSALDSNDRGVLLEAAGGALSGAPPAASPTSATDRLLAAFGASSGRPRHDRTTHSERTGRSDKPDMPTLTAERRGPELVIELTVKGRGALTEHRLALHSPNGDLYAATVCNRETAAAASSGPTTRGAVRFLWHVPVAGTWAEQLPGVWRVTSQSDGALEATAEVEVR